MKKINAEIIADSKNEHGNRITTFVLTYPRFIHAELLTHRLFSRNAASSRAIPASKMIKDIEEDPFIPVAWQKAHKGMQGTEYFENDDHDNCEYNWLQACVSAVHYAKKMNNNNITKQLVNRILEPYQWYTSIVTATELDNFFELRCPQYVHSARKDRVFKSWKDFSSYFKGTEKIDVVSRLKINKGQGEIHISLLAEAMWDAMNESTPKQLKAGEYHIPFGENLDRGLMGQCVPDFSTAPSEMSNMFNEELNKIAIKIATARCARVSYLNFEGKDDYEADIKLYDRLLKEGHMSPFEHCARAMSNDEYNNHIRGTSYEEHGGMFSSRTTFNDNAKGWSGNFRGWVQLRKEIE